MTATAAGVGRPAPVVVRADASAEVGTGLFGAMAGAALTWLGLRTLNSPDELARRMSKIEAEQARHGAILEGIRRDLDRLMTRDE